jgi:SNF2 family DNA or RNA helicase
VNSLGDLVSLLRFLHFEPFSSPAVFNHQILQPLAEDVHSGGVRLRALLRTICLRRDERLLKLPETTFEQIEVTLQRHERRLYNDIMAQCARQIDEVVSSRAIVKKYGVLFAATTKLRRLCNHGTFPTASTQAKSGSGAISTPEREEGCDLCSGADEDSLELVIQDSFCSECGRQLVSTNRSPGLKNGTTRHNVEISRENAGQSAVGISTKIQSVMYRLKQLAPGSKRCVQ